MGINVLIFVSPVVYPTDGKSGFVGLISHYNPLTYLLEFQRAYLFHGNPSGLYAYLSISIFCLFIFLEGLRFYKVSFARMVEKI